MELVCFGELTGVEKVGVTIAIILGAILLVIGIILALRIAFWKDTQTKVGWQKYVFSLPAPITCIVLGAALLCAAGWWLWRTFPADAISFSGKPWTLTEIKVRLEAESKISVELKNDVESFKIDRRVSGACASDVLATICSAYSSQLQCERPRPRAFIIGLKRPTSAQ